METDWKEFEQNNKTIALNILFIPHNTKTTMFVYKSKYNHKHENEAIFLMITEGKKWHYVALEIVRKTNGYNRPVKSLSRLFKEITSNHNGDLYCLNCFRSFCTDNKLQRHERLCDKLDYCYIEMPTKDNEILKNNHGEKS